MSLPKRFPGARYNVACTRLKFARAPEYQDTPVNAMLTVTRVTDDRFSANGLSIRAVFLSIVNIAEVFFPVDLDVLASLFLLVERDSCDSDLDLRAYKNRCSFVLESCEIID